MASTQLNEKSHVTGWLRHNYTKKYYKKKGTGPKRLEERHHQLMKNVKKRDILPIKEDMIIDQQNTNTHGKILERKNEISAAFVKLCAKRNVPTEIAGYSEMVDILQIAADMGARDGFLEMKSKDPNRQIAPSKEKVRQDLFRLEKSCVKSGLLRFNGMLKITVFTLRVTLEPLNITANIV